MLILTRRIGETIKIGDSVEVTVMQTRGNQVRLGISAPKDLPVHREEILQRIKDAAELTIDPIVPRASRKQHHHDFTVRSSLPRLDR